MSKKQELDPTYTYVLLSQKEVQEALAMVAYNKLGWKGSVLVDTVAFDFENMTARVGIKPTPTKDEEKE